MSICVHVQAKDILQSTRQGGFSFILKATEYKILWMKQRIHPDMKATASLLKEQ